MHLNWLGAFSPYDGYGRYSMALIRSLDRMGVHITPLTREQLEAPGWLQRMAGVDYSRLTIACLPPYMLEAMPGRQWSISMTEGSKLPAGWAKRINQTCERVIVPCLANAETFKAGGVSIPIHVVPGGTCPAEFPTVSRNGYREDKPYTFLALADRGARKGWTEVWQAFYRAFPDTEDVRLVVKARPDREELFDRVAGAVQRDRRVSFWREDVANVADVYAAADCFAIPSRSEGWGMPMREAAMMGLPVITTKAGGLDDGHTEQWALVVESGRVEEIPAHHENIAGEWFRADVGAVAERMRWCYEYPALAAGRGQKAAAWLRKHQTWGMAAARLVEVVERYG